ncbi:Arc family DNA-binding protein [Variovorax guangxiensis]|uniref:Arc family DNA-binding protein n=1 Tax=Variovorax guangxiensis TaxID=1775474 RepID=A0A433MLE7_9BURK|nr:Arc family DNA-binding protein [Variovorax guangxiensis]RUR68658.1 Arc family DNA-binding protein [Variovorax guangxiensis]
MKAQSQLPSVTPIRLPTELRDWLKHQAIDNRRTLGNEIVFRLEESRERQLAAQQPSK